MKAIQPVKRCVLVFLIDCKHVSMHFMYGTLLSVYLLVFVIFDFMLV